MKNIKNELQDIITGNGKTGNNALSKGRKFTLAEMKSKVSKIRKSSISKVEKKEA